MTKLRFVLAGVSGSVARWCRPHRQAMPLSLGRKAAAVSMTSASVRLGKHESPLLAPPPPALCPLALARIPMRLRDSLALAFRSSILSNRERVSTANAPTPVRTPASAGRNATATAALLSTSRASSRIGTPELSRGGCRCDLPRRGFRLPVSLRPSLPARALLRGR